MKTRLTFGIIGFIIGSVFISPMLTEKIVPTPEPENSLFGEYEPEKPEPVKEIVTIKETEYIVLEPEKVKRIDPSRIPVTKNWVLHGGETEITLFNHLTDPTDKHRVDSSLIQGFTLEELRRLHSYLHNGYSLENLY